MKTLKKYLAVCLLGSCLAFSASGEDVDIDNMTRREQEALIERYEKDPHNVPVDAQLAVAVSYATRGQLDKAEPMYREIVAREPNNARAIRGLGNICLFHKRYDEATTLLKKSWSLGDADSLKPLGFTCVAARNWEEITPLVPALLKAKESDPQPLFVLLAYSTNCKPPAREVFLQAVRNVSDEQLVARPDDTPKLAAQGFEMFGQPERAEKLRKMMSERSQSKAGQ